MLHAVLKKKAKVKYCLDNSKAEDIYTSTYWGVISYLPAPVLLPLIMKSCSISNPEVLPEDFKSQELLNVDFWPIFSIKSEREIDGKRREPDLVLEFTSVVIIVEAKKNISNPQSPTQWKEEVEAFECNNPDNEKPIVVLAVDGNEKLFNSSEEGYEVWRTNWYILCNETYNFLSSSELSSSHRRIINDALKGLSYLDVSATKWLDTLHKTEIEFDKSLKTIKEWTIK